MAISEALTFSQILKTLAETLAFAQDAKDLPDLVTNILGLKPNDLYLKSLDSALKKQQEIFANKEISFIYDLNVFSKKLRQQGIDFEQLTITPQILYEKIGTKLVSLLLSSDVLLGVDIGAEINSGWAEQVIGAANEKYENSINELLFNDAVKQQLDFVALNVKDNSKIQSDVKQLLTLFNKLVVQLTPDYKILNPKIVQELFGVSASLVEFDKIKPASEERLAAFYQGSPLWWDIILADGDVERDIQASLLEKYSVSPENIMMLCLAGEPGEGKSTLAWRIGYELSKNQNIPLIQLKDYENKDFWYSLETVVAQYEKPLIILVDDVFRDFAACRALASINPEINVMIISTSCKNEIPEDLNVPFVIDYVFLASPTEDETNRALKKIKKPESISLTQKKRTTGITSWLAIIYEITTGEELVKHIRESVRRLKKLDPIVYKAYEYLCFAGQFDIGMPINLIDRLDSSGNFYNVIDRQAAKGLIFNTNNSPFFLRTKHSIYAKFGLDVYHRNPQNTLLELIEAVDFTDQKQNIFINNLLIQFLQNGQISLVKNTLQQANKYSTSTTFFTLTEISQRIKIFQLLENDEQVRDLQTLAVKSALSGSFQKHEWIIAAKSIEEDKSHLKEFIDTTARWLLINSEDGFVRTMFLGFVERSGGSEQIQNAIESTTQWLSENRASHLVRSAFMGFIERNGDPEQIQNVIESTMQWLSESHGGQRVRSAFLGFVERKGNHEQIQEIIESTMQWLPEDRNAQVVRSAFLGFVERKGTSEQIQKITELTTQWLSENQTDQTVRSAFLGFVERKGTSEQIQEVIESMMQWLSENRNVQEVLRTFLGLVERKGTSEQIQEVIESTMQWLSENRNVQEVLRAFLGLVERKGTSEQIQSVIESTMQWLSENRPDKEVRKTILGLVERKGTSEQIQSVIESTMQWLSEYRNEKEVQRTFLGLIEQKGTSVQIQSVIESTLQWLSENRADKEVRKTILRLVERKGKPEQIEKAIESTLQWLSENRADKEVRKTILRLVERKGKPEQIEKAIESTLQWLSENRTDQEVLRNFLGLVEREGNIEQIQTAIGSICGSFELQKYDAAIVQVYLRLLNDFGTLEQIRFETTRLYSLEKSSYFKEFTRFDRSLLLARHGSLLLTLKDYREVERVSIESLSEMKGTVTARINLAWSYYYQNKKKEAFNELDHSKWWAEEIKIYPLENIYFHLGRYWFLEKKYILAKSYFVEAIQAVKPDSNPYKFYLELGRTLLELNDKGAADAFLKAKEFISQKIVRKSDEEELDQLISQILPSK